MDISSYRRPFLELASNCLVSIGAPVENVDRCSVTWFDSHECSTDAMQHVFVKTVQSHEHLWCRHVVRKSSLSDCVLFLNVIIETCRAPSRSISFQTVLRSLSTRKEFQKSRLTCTPGLMSGFLRPALRRRNLPSNNLQNDSCTCCTSMRLDIFGLTKQS